MKYLDDVLIYLGCGLILVGTFHVLPAATWFVAGAMCIAAAIMIGITRSRK